MFGSGGVRPPRPAPCAKDCTYAGTRGEREGLFGAPDLARRCSSR